MNKLKPILIEDFNKMREFGLINDGPIDKNYTIVCKKKKSARKKYYIVEKMWWTYLKLLKNKKR